MGNDAADGTDDVRQGEADDGTRSGGDGCDVAAGLSGREQTRNLVCFSTIIFLIYLAAPVLYVDVLHTALCDKLGASKSVANLPSSAAVFASLVTPVIAWAVPQTRWVIPMLAGSYGLTAVLGAVTAVLLLTVENPTVLIAATITYGGLSGLAMLTGNIYRWEALARGVSEARRGGTFSLAFGAGPLFAVAGSTAAHWLLTTETAWLSYPRNFAVLFAATVPMMALAALIATRFHLSHDDAVVKREPLVPYLFGGTWDFLRHRHFLLIVISFVLISSTMYAINNAGLYVKDAAGLEPEKMAGLLVGLRFGGKVICGLGLGWVYARFGARATLLATGLLLNGAVVWALSVTGRWYLATFALFGGGELLGAYYFTYVVAGSPAGVVKRNTALLNLAYVAVAGAPFLLGLVADQYGLRASFQAGLVVGAVAVVLLLAVPARPERLLAGGGDKPKAA